jgi:ABC-type transport system substrate-binding protein
LSASDFSGKINIEYSYSGNFESGTITISKKLWKGYGDIISESDIFSGDLSEALIFAEELKKSNTAKGYTIKSTSAEGVYYLVNGWNKNKTFWTDEKHIEKAIFKTIGQAKSSLTKLLKVMEDYKSDVFTICTITENHTIKEGARLDY